MKIFELKVNLVDVDSVEENENVLGKCDVHIINGALVCDAYVSNSIKTEETEHGEIILHPMDTVVHEISHALINLIEIINTGDISRLSKIEEYDERRVSIEDELTKHLRLGKYYEEVEKC
jgi:hypothetical protein